MIINYYIKATESMMQLGKKLPIIWPSNICLLCNNRGEFGIKAKGKAPGKDSTGVFSIADRTIFLKHGQEW